MDDTKITGSIDTSGTCCPMPMVNTNKAIKGVAPGEVLELIATDPATRQDIPDWCKRTGHTLLESEERDGRFRYLIRRAN